MGYVLNELANLPVDENMHFYIFVVNGEYREPLYDMIEKNFTQLAKSIGSQAAIAIGTNKKEFSTAVAKQYLGANNSDRTFQSLLPAMLITNAHPDTLNDDSLRLIVPLREAEARFGNWQQFFDSLSCFVRGESDEFVSRFEHKDNLLEAANKLIEMKPGLFGFSLNINELIDRWQQLRAARS